MPFKMVSEYVKLMQQSNQLLDTFLSVSHTYISEPLFMTNY